MRREIQLLDVNQGYTALLNFWREVVKPALIDGKRLYLAVRTANRTLDQNAKFHAICADLAKSGVKWAGKRRDAAQWKVLLVSGHAVATKEGADIVPGLESEFVNLRESTALMSVSRGSSLIEYSIAWCAQHGVRLSATEAESREAEHA